MDHSLADLRVVELADEQAEYCGMVLAGLGADVVKIEPPGGSQTRRIGPFYQDNEDVNGSLFFWQYNRGKRSVTMELETASGRQALLELLDRSDVFVQSTPPGYLAGLGLGPDELRRRFPGLVIARMSPFGDTGPWAGHKGSDLVHLALGGPMMNCGYTPRPDGHYDLPPIAPQLWHAYHIAGEQVAMAVVAAALNRRQSGQGQYLSCAVHEAVSKNTELDVMNWVMQRSPLFRQTCAHAATQVSSGTLISHTKDGRWVMLYIYGPQDEAKLAGFLDAHGMPHDLSSSAEGSVTKGRPIPGSGVGTSEKNIHRYDLVQRFFRRFTYDDAPWREAQEIGLMAAPLRRPEENLSDEHWQKRGTFSEVEHPELGRSFTYATSKWISTETPWRAGTRAPLVGEHDDDLPALLAEPVRRVTPRRSWWQGRTSSRTGKPFTLDGIRILDFSWFLASAGGTRFLAAMGAEAIKVEWRDSPDTRLGANAPVGGRAARERATSPLPGVMDPDMGGQFNDKNAGKRGISLNVRHPRGLEIAKQLVAMSDVVAEGFSPGVLERWGLGYDVMRSIKSDIIYAQQPGMGAAGAYGRFRTIGPIAAAFAGTSEMSGLRSPAMPAGWGYSYLDWVGAYSFATAILSALYYRERTGKGQRIDASQVEAGIFISGTALLDWSANGRSWRRHGNRSPYKPAAPHGAYRCAGEDRWIAIACFTEQEWAALAAEAGNPEWSKDSRFASLAGRLAHQDALDAAVEQWTRDQDGYELMERLQRAGVPAGVCQNAEDRVERDPQLPALGWTAEVPGTKIGTWPLPEVSVKFSETAANVGGVINRGAPCYGEDNEYVYGELLGMSTREIAALAEDNVI